MTRTLLLLLTLTAVQTMHLDEQGRLYTQDQTLTLIPYYAWCHRGSGSMSVWLPQSIGAIGTNR
ncbi:MAG: hypothetical protein IJ544_04440 [Prevotella sp.]|nr:hypothetical protein [Prevotella sp.]